MQIELARHRDAGIIAALSRDLIETGLGWSWQVPRVLRAIRNDDAVVIKAADQGELRGFAIMRFGWDEAHLDLLAVKAAHQRRGIGSALLRWLEESALTAGTAIIRLEVRETNRGAMRFYERLGYRTCRNIRGYYLGQEAAVQMARDLWCDVEVRSA